MKELKRFCSFLIVAILFTSCTKTTDFYSIQGEAQGSTYSIKYISNEEKVTKNQIDSLLTAFDLSLSTYRPDSKISKINAGDKIWPCLDAIDVEYAWKIIEKMIDEL